MNPCTKNVGWWINNKAKIISQWKDEKAQAIITQYIKLKKDNWIDKASKEEKKK